MSDEQRCLHWSVRRDADGDELCRGCGRLMVPTLRVAVEEVDRAAEFLRGRGWSGLLSFDEAIRALVEDDDD